MAVARVVDVGHSPGRAAVIRMRSKMAPRRSFRGESRPLARARMRAKELKRALHNKVRFWGPLLRVREMRNSIRICGRILEQGVDVSDCYQREDLEAAMKRAGLTEEEMESAKEGETSGGREKGSQSESPDVATIVMAKARGALKALAAAFERGKNDVVNADFYGRIRGKVEEIKASLNLEVKMRKLAQKLRAIFLRWDAKLGVTPKLRVYGPKVLNAINSFRQTSVGQARPRSLALSLVQAFNRPWLLFAGEPNAAHCLALLVGVVLQADWLCPPRHPHWQHCGAQSLERTDFSRAQWLPAILQRRRRRCYAGAQASEEA